jgi:hypothetical protein
MNLYAYVGSNPVNRFDPLGLQPVDPWTGKPNSTLRCHINNHRDGNENLLGAIALGAPIAIAIAVDSGAIIALGEASAAGAEYIATGAYFTYHAGKYVLSKAGAERIVQAAWDIAGTGQPGYTAFMEQYLATLQAVLDDIQKRLGALQENECEQQPKCLPSH